MTKRDLKIMEVITDIGIIIFLILAINALNTLAMFLGLPCVR